MANKLLKMLGLDKPRFYGKYRGIVKENADPKKLLRIRALVPKISKRMPLTWANPHITILGVNRGDYRIPAKGDGIWIEFEGGDPNYPIWTGMWCSKNDVPADFTSNYKETYELDIDKNGNYTERSEAGIKTGDFNGNIMEWTRDGIKITDKNSNIMEWTANGIKITDKNGNVIDMGSSSVKINDNFEVLQ